MHVHRRSCVGVLRSTHDRFLTRGPNFDSDLKSKWENYFLQIGSLVCAGIALDGCKWQTVSISCGCASSSLCALSGLRERRSLGERGPSPGFHGDFTCPHPGKQPLVRPLELVQGRERRWRQGRSVPKEEPGKSVLVCCNVRVSGNGRRQSLQGKLQGDAGLLHPNPLLHSLHLTESMAETEWWWPDLVCSPRGVMFFSTAHLPWCNSITREATIKLCGVRTGPVTLESCNKALGHIAIAICKPWTADAAAHGVRMLQDWS